MKGLSLLQPWIWAVLDPVVFKDIENRDWAPPIDLIDTAIALHASKGFDDDGYYKLLEVLPELAVDVDLPAEFRKGEILGVATIDRVVTEKKTLTERQRRWYFGPFRQKDGKAVTVYGWVLRDMRQLPVPIPWIGALGLWEVPPLIEAEINRQLAGDVQTGYRVPYVAALTAAGVSNATEWTHKNPGVHLWFAYNNVVSCAACGVCQPRDITKAKPCKGVVKIGLRSA